jgi:uncharacterized protein YceK
MINKNSNLGLLVSLSLLSGCASVVTGQNQSVSVDTGEVTGARCTLTNDSGTWHVNSTPGTVTILRDYSDLKVTCVKDDLMGSHEVKSTTKGMAFGNIIAGGIIGAAVDAGTGAAYDYPSSICCPIK